MTAESTPLRFGAWLAVLAAVSFGVTAPLVKIAGAGAGPFFTAALLYLGAALVSLVRSQSPEREASPRASHAPRLLLVALLGAVVAPTLLAWGLQRTAATTASLLLNLEAIFTVFLGWAFYREAIGRQVALAILLVMGGSALLVVGAADGGGTTWLGSLAIAAATLGWAFDNTLTRPLSDLDPRKVVFAKAGIGTLLSLLASLLLRETRPTLLHAFALLACGAVGYGLSLRLYLLAQRRLGAGRDRIHLCDRSLRGGHGRVVDRRARNDVDNRGRRAALRDRHLPARHRAASPSSSPWADGARARSSPRRRASRPRARAALCR